MTESGISSKESVNKEEEATISERSQATFEKFDPAGSGDLSTFLLSSAASELLGRPMTTREVWAMVEASGTRHNGLDLSTFKDLMQRFYWDTEEFKEPLPVNLVEHWFHGDGLGFDMHVCVKNDIAIMLVANVADPALAGIVEKGDKIVAINGAPLLTMDDSQVTTDL